MESKESLFLAKLLATFKIEAEEHLKNLNEGLLALENTPPLHLKKQIVETLFREAHSLKGAARAVNHDHIQTICQTVESVLSALKRQTLTPSKQMFDVLYNSIDLIGKLIEKPPTGENRSTLETLIQNLEALLSPPPSDLPAPSDATISPIQTEKPLPSDAPATSSRTEEKHQESPPPPISSPPLPAVSSEEPQKIHFDHNKTIRLHIHKLNRLFQQTEELLSLKLSSRQHFSELQTIEKYLGQFHKELFYFEKQLKIDAYQNSETKGNDKTFILLKKHRDFIKTLKEMLTHTVKSANRDYRLLGNMVDTLLDNTKKLLMQPFSTLFESFPRMVRDLSSQLQKEVHLEIQGGDIESDRRILEAMKDPLIHLIRNSIDHGIEPPEERQKKNKNRSGTIRISVAQLSSNGVEIIVSDDGKGIACDAVKKAAVKEHLITQKDADHMSDKEAAMLIFLSGVSSSNIVTELSGRGIGMGVIAEKVDKLGGHLSLDSSPNGTSIKMLLPLTLATFRGIQLKISGQHFIMPTHNVCRVLLIKKENIKPVENRMSVSVDGKVISYIHLRDILKLPIPPSEDEKTSVTTLIIKASEQTVALGVDSIVNEQEVLVKKFGKQLAHIPNILSATVIEMGEVVPILNPSDLIKSIVNTHAFIPSKSQVEEEHNKNMKKVLLAEDSMTTRVLLKNILEAAGYNVTVAVDGLEALTRLKDIQVDLLLTDVEMPNMDGFTLAENVRKLDSLKNLPIILCTSLASEKDKERGIEVGANAYIDKSNFTQSLLLDLVKKLC